jgi:poly(A) polymerase
MREIIKVNVDPPNEAFREAAELVRKLQSSGYEAYFVGGCVRDLLLKLAPDDYDIAANAKPEEVLRLFPQARGAGKRFGVSLVPVSTGEVEIAAFRQDGPYFDHRRPAWVQYAGIEEDAQRRDFSINALYYNPISGQVVDLIAGLPDLEQRILRVIGDPFERLDEDWLRLLRAVRFAARFNLEFEFVTWDALRALAPLVVGVSMERRTEEVRRMLKGPNPVRAIGLLYASGLWKALWGDLPFSQKRLIKIMDAFDKDKSRRYIWRDFLGDLSSDWAEKAAQNLSLTREEKRSIGL